MKIIRAIVFALALTLVGCSRSKLHQGDFSSFLIQELQSRSVEKIAITQDKRLVQSKWVVSDDSAGLLLRLRGGKIEFEAVTNLLISILGEPFQVSSEQAFFARNNRLKTAATCSIQRGLREDENYVLISMLFTK
jgi:hypothetical protein